MKKKYTNWEMAVITGQAYDVSQEKESKEMRDLLELNTYFHELHKQEQEQEIETKKAGGNMKIADYSELQDLRYRGEANIDSGESDGCVHHWTVNKKGYEKEVTVLADNTVILTSEFNKGE